MIYFETIPIALCKEQTKTYCVSLLTENLGRLNNDQIMNLSDCRDITTAVSDRIWWIWSERHTEY